MKKILISFFMLLFASVIYPIDKNITEINHYTENVDNLNYWDIAYALDLDVWSFFWEQLEEYDTELKKVVYEESDEFHQRLDLLRKLKSFVLNHKFSIIVDNNDLSNYDLSQAGFYLSWGENVDWGNGNLDAPKSYKGYSLKQVPISVKKYKSLVTDMYNIPQSNDRYIFNNSLFIPMSKEDAIKIEMAKDNYEIKFDFNVIGTISESFEYFGIGLYRSVWLIKIQNMPVTKNVVLSIIELDSNTQIYKKQYK